MLSEYSSANYLHDLANKIYKLELSEFDPSGAFPLSIFGAMKARPSLMDRLVIYPPVITTVVPYSNKLGDLGTYRLSKVITELQVPHLLKERLARFINYFHTISPEPLRSNRDLFFENLTVELKRNMLGKLNGFSLIKNIALKHCEDELLKCSSEKNSPTKPETKEEGISELPDEKTDVVIENYRKNGSGPALPAIDSITKKHSHRALAFLAFYNKVEIISEADSKLFMNSLGEQKSTKKFFRDYYLKLRDRDAIVSVGNVNEGNAKKKALESILDLITTEEEKENARADLEKIKKRIHKKPLVK
jgi:hypothetical protein